MHTAGLFFLFLEITAHQAPPLNGVVPVESSPGPTGSPSSAGTKVGPQRGKEPGVDTEGVNEKVHQEWARLRDIGSESGDRRRHGTPSGFLGITWYYIKTLFRLLFINGPSKLEIDHVGLEEPNLDRVLAHRVEFLKYAASLDDPDAIFLLAEMNFYGNFTYPRHYRTAFRHYEHLARLNGNSTAQCMLGLMYATGIGGAVERDQAKALIYHVFASEQGNTRSEMMVAFRHHSGIGTPRDCDSASHYYKKVADKAMAYWKSGPPGGQPMTRRSYRWAEDSGGLYGEGASVSSAGLNANRDGTAHVGMDDILEFLDMRERQGDMHATFSLGKHYYEGGRGHQRNLRKAQRQFMKVARAYWGKDGKVNPKGPTGMDKIAAKAAAHIGRMFLRGEGMEPSFEKAGIWFRRGLANGDALCQYHLGLMHRDGLGVPKDSARAAAFFKAAAEQDLANAQSHLGLLFLDQGDVETARRYFELAARNRYMEAYYYLAELSNKGIGRERNCALATAYYKIVAETAEVMHSSFKEANDAYETGDLEAALIPTIMAAEQGYETAQVNVAYILDEQTSALSTIMTATTGPLLAKLHLTPSPSASPKTRLKNAALALIY